MLTRAAEAGDDGPKPLGVISTVLKTFLWTDFFKGETAADDLR